MGDLNDILHAPEWQMDDVYQDIGSERYEASFKTLDEKLCQLQHIPSINRNNVLSALSLYDDFVTVASSLKCFVICLGAKDGTDGRVQEQKARLANYNLELTKASAAIFAFIKTLDHNDALWGKKPLSDWRFELMQRAGDWKALLDNQDLSWYNEFEKNVFLPLDDVHQQLQKGVNFYAKDCHGEDQLIRDARLVTIIKGHPDQVLRDNTWTGMLKSYSERAELYAALLNQIAGFRQTSFARVGKSVLDVSLHQNRMSREALMAMRETLLSHVQELREAVTLRAPYLGIERLKPSDLMAPAPGKKAETALIDHPKAMKIIKEGLATASPEISEFVQMMLDKQWLDARPSDLKQGGAFYSRFNEFKVPRVFSTYSGSLNSLLIQSHELGHAFHYWQMRDLPTIQTEFPMTLTEMASTFDEAVMRRYLLSHVSQEERFSILWQELVAGANMLLHCMARMEFELLFLKEREKGYVNAKRCVELMRQAWHTWYGDVTDGASDYLWAFKLHYYMTGQLIYNYPYTVGYLLSQGLIYELDSRGENFMPFYRATLRDTGRMTLDDLVSTHFGSDAKSCEFWERCLAGPLNSIRTFKKDYAKK